MPHDASPPPSSPRHWKLSDIPWQRLAPGAVAPPLLRILRATCLVESRADLYSEYVEQVVRDRGEDAVRVVRRWGQEEAQHGEALAMWLAKVDPAFSFTHKDAEYRDRVRYHPKNGVSVRGSVENELLSRCVVESLTSAYYRAIHDRTREPVLQDICQRLSRDEARHFKWFLTLLRAERRRHRAGLFSNVVTVYRRVKALEDDQIAYAFYCNDDGRDRPYTTAEAAAVFLPRVYALYEKRHLAYAVRLLLEALDLRMPRAVIGFFATGLLVYLRTRSLALRWRARRRARSETREPRGAAEVA
jgi:rubrerythrin